MWTFTCRCGHVQIVEKIGYIIKCPRCGRKYLLKKGYKYVLMDDPNLKKESKQLKLNLQP